MTKYYGLRLKPEINRDEYRKMFWKLHGYCDATWGSDPDDGRSITGYLFYLNKALISWKSKAQNHITLSSTEAEYCSSTELVKDMLHAKKILEFLGIEVEIPMKACIDNVGTIHMVRNNMNHT